jgi:actin related protein 2/3 complex subunit 2
MLLLEAANLIISDALKERFNNEPAAIDIRCADFDGVMYHLSTIESKSVLHLSIAWKCWSELRAAGVDDVLQNEYKDFVTTPEAGYDFTLRIPLSAVPTNAAERSALIQKLALLKRNAMAAPFFRAFDAQNKGQTTELMRISYREQETIWVRGYPDRTIAIFSVHFKDDTDVIIGKVFLQEFVDARRLPALQNAPQVLYYPRDPPVELKDDPLVRPMANLTYVTFVLSPRNYGKTNRDAVASLMPTFRDYLHYHIKCSKAYLHSRMRARVDSLIKILNRARPEVNVERTKTASGKTFKRF